MMVEETVLFGMGQWMESAVSVDTKTVEETEEIMITKKGSAYLPGTALSP